MNICVFMGRLTAEPELRMTPNNVMVATFTLAVERKRTKGKAATDFFDVVAWRERGEFASKVPPQRTAGGGTGRNADP